VKWAIVRIQSGWWAIAILLIADAVASGQTRNLAPDPSFEDASAGTPWSGGFTLDGNVACTGRQPGSKLSVESATASFRQPGSRLSVESATASFRQPGSKLSVASATASFHRRPAPQPPHSIRAGILVAPAEYDASLTLTPLCFEPSE